MAKLMIQSAAKIDGREPDSRIEVDYVITESK
jgi:hypothetical protein